MHILCARTCAVSYIHCIPLSALGSRCCCYSHFTDKRLRLREVMECAPSHTGGMRTQTHTVPRIPLCPPNFRDVPQTGFEVSFGLNPGSATC